MLLTAPRTTPVIFDNASRLSPVLFAHVFVACTP